MLACGVTGATVDSTMQYFCLLDQRERNSGDGRWDHTEYRGPWGSKNLTVRSMRADDPWATHLCYGHFLLTDSYVLSFESQQLCDTPEALKANS